MIILEGRTLSEQILSSLNFPADTSLHVILVGNDPSSLKYVSLKEKKCLQVGVRYYLHHLPESTSRSELSRLINTLNTDSKVTGFFIQLPLPSHISSDIVDEISQKKDVDGLTQNSIFTPAVDVGIMALLKSTGVGLSGKSAVIINDSKLIGIPLEKLLTANGVSVTVCNKFTENLPEISRGADILVSATGQKGLVSEEYIKPDAIVIDVGSGDVRFDEVKNKCSYITPPTGSVGPMTIACLLQNLLAASLS